MSTLLYLDLETTDLDTEKAEIIEIALLRQNLDTGAIDLYTTLVKPENHIPPEASAVNHLVDEDVEKAPTFTEIANDVLGMVSTSDFIAGHNIKNYDIPILDRHMNGKIKLPALDTLRLSRHTWDDLPKYDLATLYYRFGLKLTDEQVKVIADTNCGRYGQHSAAFDCFVTLNLVAEIWKEYYTDKTLQDLIELTDSPIEIKTMYFGKHKGESLAKALKEDRDYFVWFIKQPWAKEEHPDLYWTLMNWGKH